MGNNITYQCGDIGRHGWFENHYNVNWSTVWGTILPISVEISVDTAGWRTTTMSTDRLYGNNITYQCGDIGRHGWLENHYNVN